MVFFDARLEPVPKRESTPQNAKNTAVLKDKKRNGFKNGKKSGRRKKNGIGSVKSSLKMVGGKEDAVETTDSKGATTNQPQCPNDAFQKASKSKNSSSSGGKAFGSLARFWKTVEGNGVQSTERYSFHETKSTSSGSEDSLPLLDNYKSSSTHADFAENAKCSRTFPFLLQDDDNLGTGIKDKDVGTRIEEKREVIKHSEDTKCLSLMNIEFSIPEDRPWNEHDPETKDPTSELLRYEIKTKAAYPQDELHEDYFMEKHETQRELTSNKSSSAPHLPKKSKLRKKLSILKDEESKSWSKNTAGNHRNRRNSSKDFQKKEKAKSAGALPSKKKRQPRKKQRRALAEQHGEENNRGIVETMATGSKHKNFPPLPKAPPSTTEFSPTKTDDESLSDSENGCDGICLSIDDTSCRSLFSDLLCFDFSDMLDES